MHRVAIIAFDHVVACDLAVPLDVFSTAEAEGVAQPYEVKVCGQRRRIRMGHFDMVVPHGLEELRHAETIIVPGILSLDHMPSTAVLRALRDGAARGARIASICSGSAVLAEAGLLDGLRATSHWAAVPELKRRYPSVRFDATPLYVDNGNILTSAGASTGFDLCLHIIRRDYGAVAAARSARLTVMSLERHGNQAQFVVDASMECSSDLGPVLAWMAENLSRPLSLEAMARKARMSTRTFRRRFFEQTSHTPQRWMRRLRLHKAKEILEDTSLSMEEASEKSGFGSAAKLREHFRKEFRTTPTAYRQSFGTRVSKIRGDLKGKSKGSRLPML